MVELESEPLARAILAKLGLNGGQLQRSQFEGIANEVWMNDSYVVRINKDPELREDHFTESVAAPAVWKAGVLTPEPLAFSDGDELASTAYSVFRLAAGMPLGHAPALPDASAFYKRLAKEIRLLHQMVMMVSDPDNLLDPAWVVRVDDIRDKCLHPANTYLAYEANNLAESLDGPDFFGFVFCHQDLHPENTLVLDGDLTAIIDWGDAGWGDPAADLRYIPARHLPLVWEAYGADPDLRRRSALHVLDQFLYCRMMERSYGPNGESTWEEVKVVCALARS